MNRYRKFWLSTLIFLIVLQILLPGILVNATNAANLLMSEVGSDDDFPNGEAYLEINVVKPEVKRKEWQTIYASFLQDGQPVENAKVHFEVRDPSNNVFTTWANNTDLNGTATYAFKIPEDAPAPGTYHVYASAYKYNVGNITATEIEEFFVPLYFFEDITLNDTSVIRVEETLGVTALIRASWKLTETADRTVLHLYSLNGLVSHTVEMTLTYGLWTASWTPTSADPVGPWSLKLEAIDQYGYSVNSSEYSFNITNYQPSIQEVYVDGFLLYTNQSFTRYTDENVTIGVNVLDLDSTPEQLNVTLRLVNGTVLKSLSYDPESDLFEGWLVASKNLTLIVHVKNSYNATDTWFLFMYVLNNPPVIHWVDVDPQEVVTPTTVEIAVNASDYEDISPTMRADINMPNGTIVEKYMPYNGSLFLTNFTVEADYPIGVYLIDILATDSQGATAEYIISFFYMVSASMLSDALVNGTVQFSWTLTVEESLEFTVNVTDYNTPPEELNVKISFIAPNGTSYNFTASILNRYSDQKARFICSFIATKAYILPPTQAWRVEIVAKDPEGNTVRILVADINIINTPPSVSTPTYWPPVLYRVIESLTVNVIVQDFEDGVNLSSVKLHLQSPLGIKKIEEMSFDPSSGYWTTSWTPQASDEATRYQPWSFYVNATDTNGLSSISSTQTFYVLNNIPTIRAVTVSADGRVFPLCIFRVNETLSVVVVVNDIEDNPSDLKVFMTATSPVYTFTEELQYNSTTDEFKIEKQLNWTVPVGNYTLRFVVRDYGVVPPPPPPPPLPAPPPYEISSTYSYPFKLKVLNVRPEIGPIKMNDALYAYFSGDGNVTLDITTTVTDHETPVENLTVFCMVKWMNGTADASPPYIIMTPTNATMTYLDGKFHMDFNLTTDMPAGAYVIIVTAFGRDAVEFLSPEGITFRANHFDFKQPALGITEMKVETYGVGRGNQTVSISAAVYYLHPNGTWVPLNATYAQEQNWTVTASLIPSWDITIDPIYSMTYNNQTHRWESGAVVIPENMTIGDYFAVVTGGGVPSNETAVFTVTNAEPVIPAFHVPTEIMHRVETLNVTASVIDSDNAPQELSVYFFGWEPGKDPFFDPPTINMSLAYTGYNYTTITFEFNNQTVLSREIPAGNYTCSVVAWDPTMTAYPDEYSVGINMTLTILNWLPSFTMGPTLEGVSVIESKYVTEENATLVVNAGAFDLEDEFSLTANVTVIGPEFQYSVEKYINPLNGLFTVSVDMLSSYLSGNYSVTAYVIDKDGGFTVWQEFVLLNRVPTVEQLTVTPEAVYRVIESISISVNVTNEPGEKWDTPNAETVYVNLMDPLGTWTNETYQTTYDETLDLFVWTHEFPKEAEVGNYTLLIKAIDLFGKVTYSTIETFEVLNNLPTVTQVSIPVATVTLGEEVEGTIEASDIEDLTSVKVSFHHEGTWKNYTATHQTGDVYEFTVSTEDWEEGTWDVYVVATDSDDATTTYQDGTVTVTVPIAPPPPIPWEYIALGVVAIAVIMAIIYAVKMRKPSVVIKE